MLANDAVQGPGVAKYIANTLKAEEGRRHRRRQRVRQGPGRPGRRRHSAPTVVGTDTIDPKATDYSATVNKVKAADADAVFFGGYYAQAGPLVEAAP